MVAVVAVAGVAAAVVVSGDGVEMVLLILDTVGYFHC